MTPHWGAVCRPKQGQSVSGDVYGIYEARSSLLIAVIDGLGGGEEAAHAAHTAEQLIRQNPELPLKTLVQEAHAALHTTRGAVIGLLRLETEQCQASYVGVGNIGAHAYSRQPIKPISKNGILGFRLPTLLELPYTYYPGDLFVLFSDGISGRFAHDTHIDIHRTPQQLADDILDGYGKTTDDATVVVVQT